MDLKDTFTLLTCNATRARAPLRQARRILHAVQCLHNSTKAGDTDLLEIGMGAS